MKKSVIDLDKCVGEDASPSKINWQIMLWLLADSFTLNDKTHLVHNKKANTVTVTQDSDYTCDVCSLRDKSVVIHHILGQRYKSLKWEPTNRIPLCAQHHTDSSEFSAHKTPKKFMEYLYKCHKDKMQALEILKKELYNK